MGRVILYTTSSWKWFLRLRLYQNWDKPLYTTPSKWWWWWWWCIESVLRIYIYIYIHIHIHIYIYIHTYTHTRTHDIYIYIYIYVYTHIQSTAIVGTFRLGDPLDPPLEDLPLQPLAPETMQFVCAIYLFSRLVEYCWTKYCWNHKSSWWFQSSEKDRRALSTVLCFHMSVVVAALFVSLTGFVVLLVVGGLTMLAQTGLAKSSLCMFWDETIRLYYVCLYQECLMYVMSVCIYAGSDWAGYSLCMLVVYVYRQSWQRSYTLVQLYLYRAPLRAGRARAAAGRDLAEGLRSSLLRWFQDYWAATMLDPRRRVWHAWATVGRLALKILTGMFGLSYEDSGTLLVCALQPGGDLHNLHGRLAYKSEFSHPRSRTELASC